MGLIKFAQHRGRRLHMLRAVWMSDFMIEIGCPAYKILGTIPLTPNIQQTKK